MKIDIDFKITDSAKEEMKNALKESNLDDQTVRIYVESGGCSGYMYNLKFEEKSNIEKNDIVENYDELTVVVDKKSLLFLEGITLNWINESNQRGFKFVDSNTSKNCGSCGCGKTSCGWNLLWNSV